MSSFSDPSFKEMLCAAGHVAILTKYMLLKYIEAEFAISVSHRPCDMRARALGGGDVTCNRAVGSGGLIAVDRG